MFRLTFNVILGFLVLLALPSILYSQGEFAIDTRIEYIISNEGSTRVVQNITIENLYSEYYAKNYSLTLENIDPIDLKAYESNRQLLVFKEKKDNTSILRVEFDKPVVGKGARRNFTVEFSESNFVTKNGEIWEILIPRLSNPDMFRSYEVAMSVPESFGNEAYITPQPNNKQFTQTATLYLFNKEDISRVGISAGFGQFQVFSFNLKYHLENPLVKSGLVEIALPPDTAFQRMYYEKIEPQPKKILKDADGNWLATYELSPRARLDVEVYGAVELFSSISADFPKISNENLEMNLKATKYWQKDDPEIINLAKTLKTPRAIYDYVVATLSYDYERVRPNVERLGASDALENPKSAICMEFTDLFIAIARAAGIPAREINGYAYSENPEIEPLSLVADVLHSWPEYWDSKQQVWIPIDPTWADTTGGVDFFNQLDLRHFAFVIHGEDSEKPYPAGSYKLGANPQKDVFVSFGQLPKNMIAKPKITSTVKNKIPLLPPKVTIKVKNEGPRAIYNEKVEVYFDSKKTSEITITYLLPYSTYDLEVDIPYSLLALQSPETVEVLFVETRLEFPTNKPIAILSNLAAVVFLLTIFIFIALLRLKKLKLAHVFKFRRSSKG